MDISNFIEIVQPYPSILNKSPREYRNISPDIKHIVKYPNFRKE